jgi:hypothetical protein
MPNVYKLANWPALANDAAAYNNTQVWRDGNYFYIDTLKSPDLFRKIYEGYAEVETVYQPTEKEIFAAWGYEGAGDSHGKEFGGRKCWGLVLRVCMIRKKAA